MTAAARRRVRSVRPPARLPRQRPPPRTSAEASPHGARLEPRSYPSSHRGPPRSRKEAAESGGPCRFQPLLHPPGGPGRGPSPDESTRASVWLVARTLGIVGLALTLSLLLLFPTTRLTPIAKTVPLLLLLDRLERPPRAA